MNQLAQEMVTRDHIHSCQIDIYDGILSQGAKVTFPSSDRGLHGAAKTYANIGKAIADYRIDGNSGKRYLPDDFFQLGKDISYLVIAYQDSGLVKAEPLWFGRTNGGPEIKFHPSKHLKAKEHIQECTADELMVLLAAYQTGKANVFTDAFKPETSLRKAYKNWLRMV